MTTGSSNGSSGNTGSNMAPGGTGGALALVTGGSATVVNTVPSPSSPAVSSLGAGSTGTAPAAGAGMLVVTDRNGTATTTTTGKLVLLHQGRAGEDYITTTGETINGGNIVLLATEQMDMAEHDIINNNVIISTTTGNGGSGTARTVTLPAHQSHLLHSGTPVATTNGPPTTNGDEELTSLSWLQDKNLLKVSSPDSPRQVSAVVAGVGAGGRISPTSDFVEDSSSISEDNNSSANSSSEQSSTGGSYTTEPAVATDRRTPSQHLYQQHVSSSKAITTLNGDTIFGIPVITVNQHHHPHHTLAGTNGTIQQQVLLDGGKTVKVSVMTSPGPNTTATPYIVTGGSTGVPVSSSSVKYDDGSDNVEDRHYPPPAAPVKNGSSSSYGGSSTMSSPNVSGEEYSSHIGNTVTVYGGLNMIKQSPVPSPTMLSPTHNGSSSNGLIIQHHTNHYQPQQQPIATPPPQQQPLPPPPSTSSSASLSMPASPQGHSSSVSPSKLAPPKAKHPTNVPYDPLVHVNSKPPFSFSSLIFMAIENSQQKALPVKEIYAWIVHQFPYFKTAPTGWKNSVRHNLSLNKCFQKVEKAANLGKGSLWMVEPQFRPNLVQALSRSPFHAGSGMDKATYKSMQQQRSTNASPTGNGSHYSKVRLFVVPLAVGKRATKQDPFLSSFQQDNFPHLTSRLAPTDAQNGLLHHEDLDDISRSSTPIDYDGGNGDMAPGAGPHHNNQYQSQHHHLQHEQHQLPSAHHGHQQLIAVAGGGGGYHHNRHGSPEPVANGSVNATYLSSVDGTTIMSGPSGVLYMNGGAVGTALPKDIVTGREWSADTIEDVNAATAMLALKHGPKIFTESSFRNGQPPVITTSPSEDHTYSAGGVGVQELTSNGLTTNGGSTTVIGNGYSCCSSSDERYEPQHNRHSQHHTQPGSHPHHQPQQQHHSIRHSDTVSNGTSSDATYESSEESHPPHVASAEDVEERRRQEGVFALLNLAQMTYSPSPSSSMSSSTSTLSSPASSTGSLKRAAPNDAPYAPVHANYRQHAASPDRARTASPQIAHHHHLHHLQANGHMHPEAGVNTGSNILQTIPIVSFYTGGGGGGGSSSSSSGDLTRQYASPPPAKKTKPRLSQKKLKKKSLGR
uniref:Fork-head domain-containing protein n=1 Tax=Anopheles culicifacies TaxID=139723 RepID=A0A182M8D7_9DIPT